MRVLETAMSAATGEQLTTLMEEYDLVSTRFQDRGGYDIDYQIDAILDGLRISYIARDRAMQTLSGGEKARAAPDGIRAARKSGRHARDIGYASRCDQG